MAAEQTVAGDAPSREVERRVPEADTTAAENARLDPLEQESLLLNLDAALRVHARHHFFGWTQGALQSLIQHELLMCGLRSSEPERGGEGECPHRSAGATYSLLQEGDDEVRTTA